MGIQNEHTNVTCSPGQIVPKRHPVCAETMMISDAAVTPVGRGTKATEEQLIAGGQTVGQAQ